jgi:hypothetical protein
MTRAEAWFAHASAVLVGGTGLVYGWMRYFATPTDEFAVVNHPWQPTAHTTHILFAPLLVFACGLLWREHVWKRVRTGYPTRRKTGLVLFASFLAMVASGYLLQTAVEETWKLTWIWVHGVTSCVWLGSYIVHQFSGKDATPS